MATTSTSTAGAAVEPAFTEPERLALAGFLAGRGRNAVIVASVTGTDADPQSREAQVRKLAEAGVVVADSNTGATEAAIAALGAS